MPPALLPTPKPLRREHSARSYLLALGIGDFNATGIIPYLFMAPAQVDADMAAIILLVEAIQKTLNSMGARLPVSGDLDVKTVVELVKITGPNWLPMPWYEICRRVVESRDQGVRLTPGNTGKAAIGTEVAMGAFPGGDVNLPLVGSVPTAALAAGALAAAIFLPRLFKKGRR